MASTDWAFVPGDDVELTYDFPATYRDASGDEQAFTLTGRTYTLDVAVQPKTKANPDPTRIGDQIVGVVNGLSVTFSLPAADSVAASGNAFWVTETFDSKSVTVFEGRIVDAQPGGGSRTTVTVAIDPVVRIVNTAAVGPAGPAGNQTAIDAAIDTHIAAAEPHPAYDDMASLTLLFENALL